MLIKPNLGESKMENQAVDQRELIYQDLHGGQLEAQEIQNRHSAEKILGIVFDVIKPDSVLDVGCGLGTWLSVARELGVADTRGVDGLWTDNARLRIPAELVSTQDLEKPLELGRKFDMVMSLEVAEHLDQSASVNFVDSLTNHADVILFSAAIPYQGGHHHVNEQFPDYWYSLFHERGFEVLDFIRPKIWNDDSILWWLKQNILLFVRKELLESNQAFADLYRNNLPISIVHPEVYLSRLNSANFVVEEHNKLIGIIASGGIFSVKRESDGNLTINKIGNPLE